MTIRPPQHILTQILLRKDRLTQAIRTAIDYNFTAAERGCVGNPGEVDRLVYFFLEGLPVIESQFNGILDGSGVRATLSGIFCHQTPRVMPVPASATTPLGCELGDILFLVTYGDRLYGRYLGNAFLVQAKEDASTVDGTTQAHLYEKAAAYTYSSPPSLAPQSRSFGGCKFALWYWGFRRRFWHYPAQWMTEGVAARPRLDHRFEMPFENALMDLICGVNGHRVRALEPNSTESGWSKIVDDLIRVTAHSCFTRQNAYVSRNKEPLRGEEIIRVLQACQGSPSAPFLVRCSLDRIFGFFDEDLARLGKELTARSHAFDRDRFLSNFPQKGESGSGDGEASPPTLGNERPEAPDGDEGGCSFVIIDFEG